MSYVEFLFMHFDEAVEFSISNLEEFDNGDYILGENSFIRNRTWGSFDYIIFILTYAGESTTEALESFVEEMGWDESKKITKQALSKQRVHIDPHIFKAMSYKFMGYIFDSEDYVPLFKGHHVVLSDGSKAEIPNLREVKEEFDVAPDTEKYTQPARTLFSTLIDAKYGFVLDSILGKSRSSERDLLKKHLENVKKYMDFEKTIIVLDRGYYSLELLLLFDLLGLKYIFRLKSDIYKDERDGMGDDEYLDIKLNDNRTQKVTDETLLKQIENKEYITRRFVNYKIKKESVTLLTNMSPEFASLSELKDLYTIRWKIEMNYDKMKNKLRIEEYSGRKEINIQQDFYAKTYLFNLYQAINNKSQEKLEDINNELRDEQDKERRPNSNLLIGRIRKKLYSLITSTVEEIKEIITYLIDYGARFTIIHYFNRETERSDKKTFTGKNRSNIKRA